MQEKKASSLVKQKVAFSSFGTKPASPPRKPAAKKEHSPPVLNYRRYTGNSLNGSPSEPSRAKKVVCLTTAKKPSVPRQSGASVPPRTKPSVTRQVLAFDVHILNNKKSPQRQLRARVVPPPPPKKSIVNSVPKKPSKSKITPSSQGASRKVSSTAKKQQVLSKVAEQENQPPNHILYTAATGLYRVTEEPPPRHKFNPSPFVVKMPSSSDDVLVNIQVSQSSPVIAGKKHKFSFGGPNQAQEQECRSRTHGTPLRSKGEAGSPVSLSQAAFEYLLQSSQRQNNFAIANILRNLSSSDKSQSQKKQMTTFSNSSKGNNNNQGSPPMPQGSPENNPFKGDTLASPPLAAHSPPLAVTPASKALDKENTTTDLPLRLAKHEPVIVKT